MFSPQRAVAAVSGGAGEARNSPRTRSMANPAALPARARRRPPVRTAVPPCPGAGTARPTLGSLGPRLRGWGLLAGPRRSAAGGALLGPLFGAASFGGRALRPGKAASAPLGCCCESGAPALSGAAPGASGHGAPSRGSCPALRGCSPLFAWAPGTLGDRDPWAGSSSLVNGRRERESRCFIIVQPFRKGLEAARLLRIGYFVFLPNDLETRTRSVKKVELRRTLYLRRGDEKNVAYIIF